MSSSATTTTTVYSGGVSSHTNPIFTVGRQSNAVSFGEIRDLYTPFTQESVVSSFSCLNYPEEPRKPQNQKRPLSLSASSSSVTSKPTGSNTSRSKRRFDFLTNLCVTQQKKFKSFFKPIKKFCIFFVESIKIPNFAVKRWLKVCIFVEPINS